MTRIKTRIKSRKGRTPCFWVVGRDFLDPIIQIKKIDDKHIAEINKMVDVANIYNINIFIDDIGIDVYIDVNVNVADVVV